MDYRQPVNHKIDELGLWIFFPLVGIVAKPRATIVAAHSGYRALPRAVSTFGRSERVELFFAFFANVGIFDTAAWH